MIAHRLTTVRRCDRVIQLESGRIVALGKYQDLIDQSQDFRAMASANGDA
jgi:ATP-binding cassette subfamily B protein